MNEYKVPTYEEHLNEKDILDKSYTSVLFGKMKKKWKIIAALDDKRFFTSDELTDYAYQRTNDKYLGLVVINNIGGNRGESAQQDANNKLDLLNNGKINKSDDFGEVIFIK